MNTVNEFVCVNNHRMLIDAIIQLPHVIVTPPSIGDNCTARQHMIANNAFKCGCITPCDHLKPATTSMTLDQTNDPFTTTSATTVVFTVEKVTFVDFY